MKKKTAYLQAMKASNAVEPAAKKIWPKGKNEPVRKVQIPDKVYKRELELVKKGVVLI